MIYYPLSVLILAGIREILIISTPNDLQKFERIFVDGSQLGLKFTYKEQPSPDGLAQAFILGEEFNGNDDVCLVLGDNIFYGVGLQKLLNDLVDIVKREQKAVNFGYYVDDPERYGVAEIDENGSVLSIEEKPLSPKSNYAVVDLYFYPNSVISIAKNIKPSKRGELEITTVNQTYLNKNELKLQILSRGYAWLDTGTHEALSEATEFDKAIEKRTSLKIACVEEIAYIMKFIDKETLQYNISIQGISSYGEYLHKL